MKLIGSIEYLLALLHDGARLAVVEHRWREQAEARVAVFSVVPTKKSLTEGSTVLDAAEAIRELRTILQRAELTFRVEVVVREVRTAVRLGYAQIRQ